MMLWTLAFEPPTCAATLPQKFSAATTRLPPAAAAGPEPQAANASGEQGERGGRAGAPPMRRCTATRLPVTVMRMSLVIA